jgi:hypothetical protein
MLQTSNIIIMLFWYIYCSWSNGEIEPIFDFKQILYQLASFTGGLMTCKTVFSSKFILNVLSIIFKKFIIWDQFHYLKLCERTQ